MNPDPGRDTASAIRDGDALDRAILAARRRVIRRHRQLGIPLVVWRDGQVAEIAAESVDLSRELGEVGPPEGER